MINFNPFSDGLNLPLLILEVVLFIAIVTPILREYWCWFFKINQLRDLLKEIESNTRKKEKND